MSRGETPKTPVFIELSRCHDLYPPLPPCLAVLSRQPVAPEWDEGGSPAQGRVPLFDVGCWTLDVGCSQRSHPLTPKPQAPAEAGATLVIPLAIISAD